MVDLPTVGNGIVTSTAPQSSVSRGDIAGNADLMASALGKVADAGMDIATKMAKEEVADALQKQKVTLNADGSVNVENPASAPLIFGRAGEAYHAAIAAGTIAQHSNVISQEMNVLHQKYETDPQGFKAASDAWKAQYLSQHGTGEVGAAIKQQADDQQTRHSIAITNTAGKIDLQQQDSALTAAQNSARDDVIAMLRGGANLDDKAVQSGLAKYDAAIQARASNPLFGYSKEQARLDSETFHSEAAASRFLYHNDQIYKDGGKTAALKDAEDILSNPSYKLSPPQREQYYHKAVGEIRANEAIRKQDIGEARAAASELRLQFAAGVGVSSDDVEHVAKGFEAAGDPGGAAALRSSFLRKPLIDDHGNQPLDVQTKQLNALVGMNAVRGDVQALIAKGYSPQAAAAIGSHAVHESGGNSSSYNPNDAGTGPSAGLFQFHAERLTSLKAYAASVNKPWTDRATQLDFMDRELHSPAFAGTLTKLQTAKTPEEAAAAFYDYERPAGWKPGDISGVKDAASRTNMARSIFEGRPSDMSMGPAGSAWLIAHRQYAVNDAAVAQWKTIMADYDKEGTRPATKTVTDIQNAAFAARNGALLDIIAADSRRMNISGEAAQMTLPEQSAQNAQLTTAGARGEPLVLTNGEIVSRAVQKDLQARTDAITTGLKDNPIATAANNLPYKIKPQPPVDWSSDQSAAASLQARGKIAQVARQNWQTGPLSALDSADVAQVQGMLSNPDPAVKGRVFNALSALPEEERNATLAKIGKDRPELMVSVAAGSMMKTAPDVASGIIRGQQAIAMDKGYIPAKGAEATAFDQEFDKRLPASTFSLAARTDASGPYAVAQGMVKARYADLSAQAADTSGKLDQNRLQRAVDDVTGGILDHNGGKLIAPARGMPQSVFDKTMYGITDADLGNGPVQSHLAEANAALNLTPQETALYQRHLTNLYGAGGVTNANGSRSTLFQTSFEQDGKTYNVPTVYDGKILPPREAMDRAIKEGLDKFPSYNSEDEAEARYQKMHDFMEKDTGDYFHARDRSSVTTLSGEPVTANYLRNSATLESVGDGRYYVKLGNDPLRPVYAYQGANTESPQKFMLDLRNRPRGVVPPATPIAMP